MFFESWFGIFRVVVISALAYFSLIAILRISGERTLSKWNAFDFIVTIALGSTLATVIISKDVVFAEGVLALLMLVALQFAITWSSVRLRSVRKTVKGEPQLLLLRGNMIKEALRKARVTESEVFAAVRSNGKASLVDDGEAVVLETDGTFSVVCRSGAAEPSALSDVAGYER